MTWQRNAYATSLMKQSCGGRPGKSQVRQSLETRNLTFKTRELTRQKIENKVTKNVFKPTINYTNYTQALN